MKSYGTTPPNEGSRNETIEVCPEGKETLHRVVRGKYFNGNAIFGMSGYFISECLELIVYFEFVLKSVNSCLECTDRALEVRWSVVLLNEIFQSDVIPCGGGLGANMTEYSGIEFS